MALSKNDLNQINGLILDNNNLIFSKMIDTLKHFVTRDEFNRTIGELRNEFAKQEDLLELKSDMIEVKQELRMITAFIMSK